MLRNESRHPQIARSGPVPRTVWIRIRLLHSAQYPQMDAPILMERTIAKTDRLGVARSLSDQFLACTIHMQGHLIERLSLERSHALQIGYYRGEIPGGNKI